jgi:hypothetical protein
VEAKTANFDRPKLATPSRIKYGSITGEWEARSAEADGYGSK